MRIIFLDIDGVMNNELFYVARSQGERSEDGLGSNIDERCIDCLNGLIEATGAKVVITSTWRMSGIDYCRQHLEAKGFKGEIIDITPNLKHEGCVRGNEIQYWINKNSEMLCGSRVGSDFKEYVIIDDDDDMLLCQRNNFIQIDGYCGLTYNNTHKAKFILCSDMTFSKAFNLKD